LPFPSKKTGARKIKNVKAIFLLGSALTRGRRDSLGRLGIPPQTPPAEPSSLKRFSAANILKLIRKSVKMTLPL